jgi:DNA-binding response OmpR family regulator
MSSKRILIVEDNDDLRDLWCDALDRRGYAVVGVAVSELTDLFSAHAERRARTGATIDDREAAAHGGTTKPTRCAASASRPASV